MQPVFSSIWTRSRGYPGPFGACEKDKSSSTMILFE